MVHLEKTEKFRKKLSRSVATVCTLAVGTRIRRSVVLVENVVTPVPSVSPPLRRGIVLIYGKISQGTNSRKGDKKITHQSNEGPRLRNRGW